MLKWLARRRIAAFERAFDYDASYMRDMLDISARGFMRFTAVARLSEFRQGLPVQAQYAAQITALLAEDCGPCTQLAVTMAEKEQVPAEILRAILDDEEAAMGEDAALAWRFTRATLAHDAAADDLRREVVQRWGEQALLTLALSIAASRVYPTVKYALGHGQTCVRVRVGGELRRPSFPKLAGGEATVAH